MIITLKAKPGRISSVGDTFHAVAKDFRRRRAKLLTHDTAKDVPGSRALEVLAVLGNLAQLDDAGADRGHEHCVTEDAMW